MFEIEQGIQRINRTFMQLFFDDENHATTDKKPA